MELLNAVSRYDESGAAARAVRQEALEIAVLCLSPMVPHITHALWHELGHERALIDERWPAADAAALAQDSVEIVVQVNGKLRGRISVASGADEAAARALALADEGVRRFVGDAAPRRVIYVPGKLLNFVV
jgi:leucyl-tRNA synthetase